LRNILWTTTIHISGLHHAAYILVPSSFVLPLLGVHVDFTPDLLARLWSGGIYTSPVRTHWVTLTNFMGSLPIPRFRVYLGTSKALLAPNHDSGQLLPDKHGIYMRFDSLLECLAASRGVLIEQDPKMANVEWYVFL
jgi:hypothetical protein